MDGEQLQAKVVELEAKVDKLATDRDAYRELYLKTLEQCRKLELGLRGQQAERLPPNEQQLTLQLLSTLLGKSDDDNKESEEQPKQRVREHERKRPTGRQKLPEDLPRNEIELLPREDERQGLDAFARIGVEERELIERRPASMVVVVIKRPKFVRKTQQGRPGAKILIAPPLPMPIEGGVAGPGLLADTIARRWADHLPLHRLEGIYAREAVEIARSTMCSWHEQLCALCKCLVVSMRAHALETSPYLCVDATGVLVQAKHKCRRAHFWVLVAPGTHVIYGYSKKHDSAAVDKLLAGYKGYLVADAHAVYDHLFASGDVVEVGCWAHVRRYYFKALESDPERARVALGLIGELFRIEREVAGSPRKKRLAARNKQSRPVVDKFFTWCDEQVDQVLDETPIAKAIGYARNQREALERFLEDNMLPIHNNTSELSLRREVVGRKNWLFLGSDAAAEVNTTFVSLIASCQMHGIEPWAYLRDLFCLIPNWPAHRVLELAPAFWNDTLQKEETQRLLAADVLRQVTLVEPGSHPDQG